MRPARQTLPRLTHRHTQPYPPSSRHPHARALEKPLVSRAHTIWRVVDAHFTNFGCFWEDIHAARTGGIRQLKWASRKSGSCVVVIDIMATATRTMESRVGRTNQRECSPWARVPSSSCRSCARAPHPISTSLQLVTTFYFHLLLPPPTSTGLLASCCRDVVRVLTVL